jgi:hypothetical protein
LEEPLSSRQETVEIPNNGTSINNHSPSDPDLTTNLGTLEAPVKPATCKSGAPAQSGGKHSPMKATTSSTSKTEKHLMFTETEMKKEERLLCGESTMVITRDGQSSILIKLLRKLLQDTAKNGVCGSAEHSISDQDFQ